MIFLARIDGGTLSNRIDYGRTDLHLVCRRCISGSHRIGGRGPIWLQAVVFLAVSLLMLYFTRPWAMKYIQPKKVRTNYEEALGKDVRHRACRQSQRYRKAMYNGMEWTARSEKEEVTFEPEDSAEVTGIEGVKLILRKKEEV